MTDIYTSDGLCMEDFMVDHEINGRLVRFFDIIKFKNYEDIYIEKINYYRNKFWKFVESMTDLTFQQITELVCYGYITDKYSIDIATDELSVSRMNKLSKIKEQEMLYNEDLKILRHIYQTNKDMNIKLYACV